jgi:hypothetical protein
MSEVTASRVFIRPSSVNITRLGAPLNHNWFTTLADAKEKIERWRTEYNEERPHSLAYRTPEEFAKAYSELTNRMGLTAPIASEPPLAGERSRSGTWTMSRFGRDSGKCS